MNTQNESPKQKRTGMTILDLLFVPLGCLPQASPTHLMLSALVLAVVGRRRLLYGQH